MQTELILVGGDVNSWSTWWGSTVENTRGENLKGFLNEQKLELLNIGVEPTFDTIRGGRRLTSCVDITVCTAALLPCVYNWRVDGTVTSADHNAIVFDVHLERPSIEKHKSATRIYSTKKADWFSFAKEVKTSLKEHKLTIEEIGKISEYKEIENAVDNYEKAIKEACEKILPKIKTRKKVYLPWWNENLTELKKEMIRSRRRIRGAASSRRDYVVGEYLKAKLKYEDEASAAQTRSWKEFCSKQGKESMWDSIYRVIRGVTKKQDEQVLVGSEGILGPKESTCLLASTFFPDDNDQNEDTFHADIRKRAEMITDRLQGDTDDPPFTPTELKRSLNSFNPKKAPGGDGFTSDICFWAITTEPEIFLGLLNKCLELACFPYSWKEATVIVLKKPGRDNYSVPKSYRPIGLLPILGKVLEKMMVKRIKWHLLPKTNSRQYGFVPQQSTEDALYDLVSRIRCALEKKESTVIVSLDIEGAFDNAWWPSLKCRLLDMRCPHNLRKLANDYLKERRVSVRYMGQSCQKLTGKGCVQGSVGGPIFWNLLLNPLLDELEGKGAHVQAFADDIVLVFSGHKIQKIQAEANIILAHVYEWGVRNKLNFAPQKTKAMIITRKRRIDTPLIHMNSVRIEFVDEIKILGLVIDRKLNFKSHVSYVCRKALNIYKGLACAARLKWGLSSEIIRTMYVSVIEPIIMYASSAWAPAVGKIMIQKQLNSVQRGFAQKIAKAYRTVSLNAALILAGLLPLDLRILEAARLFEAKRGRPIMCLQDRQLEGRVSYLHAPHPAEEVDISYNLLSDGRTESTEKHRLPHIQIYTDGSKTGDQVGAAYSCWQEGTEIETGQMRLGSFCTVFQAELYALLQATQYLLSKQHKEVAVLSDSRSSLDLVSNPDTSLPLATNIRRNIKELMGKGTDIRLYWVKAHIGIAGNERADELAKAAAQQPEATAEYDRCPLSYAKSELRRNSVIKWAQRYTEGATAAVTKMFLPNAVMAYHITRKIKISPELTQAMTGHGGFAAYLYRFKCKDNPACACDEDIPETIQHILIECPRYSASRLDLEIATNIKLTDLTLSAMLTGKDSRPYLEEYCKKVVKDAASRNKSR